MKGAGATLVIAILIWWRMCELCHVHVLLHHLGHIGHELVVLILVLVSKGVVLSFCVVPVTILF